MKKNGFFCPNGHEQSYRKSTADTLREELNEKQKQYDIAQQRIRNLTEQISHKQPKRRAVRKAV